MRKETWSVGFACALGAFIGALSALEIQSYFTHGSYFWTFGALLGGLVAYCAVDFRHFCTGVSQSYRKSADNIAGAYRHIAGWEPDVSFWRATLAIVCACWAFIASLVLLCTAAWAGIEYLGEEPLFHFLEKITVVITAIAMIVIIAVAIMSVTLPMHLLRFEMIREYGSSEYREALHKSEREAWRNFTFFNPVVLPFVLVWFTVTTLWGAVTYLWRNGPRMGRAVISLGWFVIREFGRFVARTFINVHSDRRTLCFVDATLGATAGFFLGSAILGATIGAILGVINYEIVSVRWLKLVPARAK